MAIEVDGKTLLTYSDYVKIPEDRNRHEIIAGVHYVTPSPVPRHQRISRRIQFQLYRQIEEPGLGEVFDAPVDLLLSDTDIVVPDLVVVLERSRSIVTPKNLQGVPDLVVEITSPSTRKRDLELKKSLYESHGVPEYWIVLSEEDAVEKWVLADGEYRLDGREAREITFSGLPGVTVALGEVWKD